ncbi:autophagy-related protein 27 [Aspergillus lucknowensis]|uniref:Autophagy-related protein 27 n=1 Tax=Aspergillus lucknowensis TaxID=176173 RepID=A0ABR4M5Q4_9EURO
MRIPSSPLFPAASLLPGLAAAITFNCAQINADGYKYDLSPLGGVHTIYHAEKNDNVIVNTTYVMNICTALGGAANRGHLQCGTSRNICGFQYEYDDESKKESSFVFPIAGLEHMGHGAKDPEITRLKKLDADTEGLQVKLRGGKYPNDSKKSKDASAVIEFVCDHDRTGLEGLVETPKRLLRAREEDEDGGDDENDGDGEGDGEGKGPFDDGSDPNRSLEFKSFGPSDDESYVLRLNWRTQYACDNYLLEHGSSSGHWGFFTWLIIIFFLCAAAYLVFGSWLNYNRYGARGWDLLPHGDTIRDVPYLFQDWLRRVINTLQGTGSRGGYSAV